MQHFIPILANNPDSSLYMQVPDNHANFQVCFRYRVHGVKGSCFVSAKLKLANTRALERRDQGGAHQA